VSNTTITRPGLASRHATEAGGLSGAPLFEPSTALLRRVAGLSRGTGLTLIGCGGVATGAQALAKIKAGASLVQFYAALAQDGPALVPRMLRDLAAALRREGFASATEAVGVDVR